MFGLFSKKWNPDGKHVYITGGSSGLGLSLAQILASKGADISIVARNQEKLDKALELLEKLRVSPGQKFNVYSLALSPGSEAVNTLETVCKPFEGEAPDAVFTCAGSSKPKFFVEMNEQELFDGMTNAYWIQAWTAWAAAKKMSKMHKTGAKIILVSSTLGYMSFLGWGSYSPGKHALRGLSDALHSELMLYGIDVHIHFPAMMYTPGFDEENKTKPAISKEIESADKGVTADEAAQVLYLGVVNGDVHIAGDFITRLFRAGTRGAVPRNNWFMDAILDMIAFIGIPMWRASVDRRVLAHREEHQLYLTQQGYFS